MRIRLTAPASIDDWAAAAPTSTRTTGKPRSKSKFVRHVADPTAISRDAVSTMLIDQVAETLSARVMASSGTQAAKRRKLVGNIGTSPGRRCDSCAERVGAL